MKPRDLAQLKDDLLNFRAELEEPGVRAELVATALPRLLGTLEMIPDALAGGDILELGSSPYFLSLCLHRLCSGTLRHGNYFGTADQRGADRLVNQRTGETVTFAYELFNIETDPFPYPDASFDVVVFSELIEHLGVNPVCTLSEIHRVLRPGGVMVVTTPNKLSLERFATFAHGGSQMVDRYSPLFGYGARHNREYGAYELRDLIEHCGFPVEELAMRDLVALPLRERLQRALWRLMFSWYSNAPREEHIFLRARRGERFRWYFPVDLFDNIQFYVLVKYPWVEMGYNDSIQCGAGWHPLERSADGARRWINGDEGQGFLKTPADVQTFGMEVFAPALPGAADAAAHVIVWDRWLGRVQAQNVYVDAPVRFARGSWQRVELPLQRFPRPGDEVEVKIGVPGGTAQPAVAVRKFWFAGKP